MTPYEIELRAWVERNEYVKRLEERDATIAALTERAEAAESALRQIATLGGNLPNHRLIDRTGPNDAAHRGLMYCHAREIARRILMPIPEALEPATRSEASNPCEVTPKPENAL